MASLDVVAWLLLIGSALILIGIASSLVARRFGAPLLFVFLLIGMLAGQDGPGGIVFNDYQATYLVGSTALAIILFDGGLRTRLSIFRGVLVPALLLATVGVVLTTAILAVIIAFVLDFSWLESALLGGIVASTDAAAVFFLLRSGGLQLRPKVGAILEIESGTNDPIAMFLTVLLTGLVLSDGVAGGSLVVLDLVRQGLIGAALGTAGGFAAVWCLNRLDLPSGLHPLLVSAAVVLVFALSGLVGGSGFLAVYLMGLVLGNRPIRAYPSIVSFHEAATWLSQIVMFLVLGLLVTPTTLVEYAVPGVIIAVLLILLARPAAVVLCLLPFGLQWRELGFVSWVGLRGAVSIFLAAIPTLAGVPEADAYFNVAFFVVLISLVVQGWSIRPLAMKLGLALPGNAPSVSRVELDLPGQVDQELVGYPLSEDAPVLALGALPPWVRLVMVVRKETIHSAEEAGTLRPGDYAYFLVPPQRVDRLDRLFTPRQSLSPPFGELPVNTDAAIAALAELYGLVVPQGDEELTVCDFMLKYLDDEPETGDALVVGDATLVVREAGDGEIRRIGLQLPELTASGFNLDRLSRLRQDAASLWQRTRTRVRP